MLNTIWGTLGIGFAVGLLVGLIFRNNKVGCTVLVSMPVMMVGYVAWWQSQHPENIRSTSGLDFIFGPLWPSFGAIVGYAIARSILDKMKK